MPAGKGLLSFLSKLHTDPSTIPTLELANRVSVMSERILLTHEEGYRANDTDIADLALAAKELSRRQYHV